MAQVLGLEPSPVVSLFLGVYGPDLSVPSVFHGVDVWGVYWHGQCHWQMKQVITLTEGCAYGPSPLPSIPSTGGPFEKIVTSPVELSPEGLVPFSFGLLSFGYAPLVEPVWFPWAKLTLRGYDLLLVNSQATSYFRSFSSWCNCSISSSILTLDEIMTCQ